MGHDSTCQSACFNVTHSRLSHPPLTHSLTHSVVGRGLAEVGLKWKKYPEASRSVLAAESEEAHPGGGWIGWDGMGSWGVTSQRERGKREAVSLTDEN